ncbi:MAG: methylmalonyl-CoA mutase family protein, partial [Thermodesulfobacteriota bacterium]
TNSRDEAYALPTEDSVRLALRTQQLIAYESGVADVIDPFGGAYAVESLTDEIEKKSVEYIEKIEAMGGAIKAIESGYIQGEIGESAYQYQKEIENKKRIIVGLNQFQMEEEPLRNILRIKPEVEQYQKEKLARVKRERDTKKVKEALAVLKKAAQGTDNVVPPILDAVKAYATLGEISDTLREVFGEYRER